MKIDKKQFNKLSQLDRIEFRQREIEINKKVPVGYSLLIFSGIIISIYIAIFLLCNIYATLNGVALVELSKVIWLILPFSFLIDLYFNIRNQIETNKLVSEYFKVEVKKK